MHAVCNAAFLFVEAAFFRSVCLLIVDLFDVWGEVDSMCRVRAERSVFMTRFEIRNGTSGGGTEYGSLHQGLSLLDEFTCVKNADSWVWVRVWKHPEEKKQVIYLFDAVISMKENDRNSFVCAWL